MDDIDSVNWEVELGFSRGDYPPSEHDSRCKGRLIDCEDTYKGQTTVLLYLCWECRRFWEFLPDWITEENMGQDAKLALADELWRRYSEDGVLRLGQMHHRPTTA